MSEAERSEACIPGIWFILPLRVCSFFLAPDVDHTEHVLFPEVFALFFKRVRRFGRTLHSSLPSRSQQILTASTNPVHSLVQTPCQILSTIPPALQKMRVNPEVH